MFCTGEGIIGGVSQFVAIKSCLEYDEFIFQFIRISFFFTRAANIEANAFL